MILYNFRIPFFVSASPIFDLLSEELSIEIVCVGYFNSGKYSVISSINNIKGLTKVSCVSGSIKYINFFEINVIF